MGYETYKGLVVGVLIAIWLCNMFIPLIIGAFDHLFSFWGRCDAKGWYSSICEKRSDLQGDSYCRTEPLIELILVQGLIGGVILGTTGLLLVSLYKVGIPPLWVLILCVTLICVIYIPRFVLDICKATKYNKNTGNMERIDQLEKQIEAIKKGE